MASSLPAILFAGYGSSGATTTPLDGLTATGAWSGSRKLYSTYSANGGAYYALTSSKVSTWYDQSGNSRNATDVGVSANRPSISSVGPNSRDALAFVSTNSNYLDTSVQVGTFMSSSAGYMIVSCYVDSLVGNSTTATGTNDCILADSTGFMGITVRTGMVGSAFVWDGANKKAETSGLSTGTPYVFTWRLSGGNIFQGVNGVETAGSATGNLGGTAGNVRFGWGSNSNGKFFTGKIFEAAVFATVPSSGTRSALEADFKSYIGA